MIRPINHSNYGHDSRQVTTLFGGAYNEIPCGIWMPNIDYSQGSLVFHYDDATANAYIYRSLADNNRGNLPQLLAPWWEYYSTSGLGPPTQHNFCGEYNPLFGYTTNQIANYNGVLYIAIAPSTGQQPDISPAVWSIYVPPTVPVTRESHTLTAGVNVYFLSGTPTQPNLTDANINGQDISQTSGHYVLVGNQITLVPLALGYSHKSGWELEVFWQ